ncbi:MAG: tetratricopeptide repeat protein [Pirellulaceae bacterium]
MDHWTRWRSQPWCLLVALAWLPGTLLASPADAAAKVRQGLQWHAAGSFAQAEQAFAEAARLDPDNPRVVYDQACALAAQGKLDEAEALFHQARLGRDADVVAASHYNLGCIASDRARALLGEEPAAAPPNVRSQVVELVLSAVGSFRSTLQVDPEHPAARHNLELLRVWLKHIQELWRQRDRDHQRQSLGLLEFLEFLESEQQALRQHASELADSSDSPRRRQAARLLAESQRLLAEEIAPLQDKIRDAAQAPTSPGPPSSASSASAPSTLPTPDPRVAAAVEVLASAATQVRQAMTRAATELQLNELAAAQAAQTDSLEKLDTIYRAIAPWEHVLHKAIRRQRELVARSQAAVAAVADGTAAEPDSATTPADSLQSVRDAGDAAWAQQQVPGWADLLVARAEQQLKDAPAEPDTPQETSPPRPIEAWKKAVERGPRVVEAARYSAERLQQTQWSEALPRQEEARKLLEEIAAALPPPPAEPDQQKPDQQKPDQQKPDQQKPDQQKSDQQKSDQQKPDQQKPDQQKPEQQKPEQQKSESEKSHRPGAPKGSSEDGRSQPGPAIAPEVLLRQVREREREYKERQRKVQALLRGASKVDKDW